MKTSKRGVAVARDMAALIVAHDALEQAINKVTNFDDMSREDRIIMDIYHKLSRIMAIYRGSRAMVNGAKIALNAYNRVGHDRPNATSFAISVISLAYEKSGLKFFPVAKVHDLCDIADAVIEVLGGTEEMTAAADYAEKIVDKIYKSHPDHIDASILHTKKEENTMKLEDIFIIVKTDDGKFRQALPSQKAKRLIEGVLAQESPLKLMDDVLDGMYTMSVQEAKEKRKDDDARKEADTR